MAARRSSRRKTPRKKYTANAFEGIEGLTTNQASDNDEQPGDPLENTDDNDEFHTEPGSPSQEEVKMSGVEHDQSVEEDDDEDDEDEDEEDDSDNGNGNSNSNDESEEEEEEEEEGEEEDQDGERVDDSASDAGEVDLDDGISIADEDAPDAADDTDQAGPYRVKQIRRNDDGEELYTRGADDSALSRSGVWRKQHYFGPAREDREAIHRASIRWSRETCLPTRKQRRGNLGGLEYPVAYQIALKNADINWRWYSLDGGQDAFRQRQALHELSDDDARGFWCIENTGNRSLVMGPVKEQVLAHLVPGESFPLAEPFETDGKSQSQTYKPGFLLNLGARVQALDWAPNRHDRHQYLAVSIMPARDEAQPHIDRTHAPAFAPGLPHQSSVQIWRFTATTENYIDRRSAPQLAMMLCTAIGDIKALKWCPVPLKIPEKLGLLAFISADGATRVLDIDTPPLDQDTCYRSVKTFAFVSKPPDTVCTCLTWLSSTRLAAGCANGFVAVWDLPRCLSSNDRMQKPVIYAALSVTYILGIASCWPSSPHLLATTSMAGYLTLTDITKPRPGSPENTVISIRNRIGQQMLLWNDHAQSVMSVDDSYVLRSYLLRRFFTTLGITRFRAIALCMASSPCHPFILSGTANGEVLGCNPVVRIASGSKALLWQQIWFKHEWRRPSTADKTRVGKAEQEQARVTIIQDGLTRFLEGFRVENVNLNSDGKTGPNIRDGVQYATVYEEKSAITALAWNPNLHVGGWAAAGMGDGLLRVEDLAS